MLCMPNSACWRSGFMGHKSTAPQGGRGCVSSLCIGLARVGLCAAGVRLFIHKMNYINPALPISFHLIRTGLYNETRFMLNSLGAGKGFHFRLGDGFNLAVTDLHFLFLSCALSDGMSNLLIALISPDTIWILTV